MAVLHEHDTKNDTWKARAVREPFHSLDRHGRALVYRQAPTSESEAWILLSEPGGAVVLNGDPVRAGVVVLQSRDEIRLESGERFFLLTERAAAVETYTPAGEDEIRCARCRRWLVPGDEIVRCPAGQCGVISHQSEKLPCFTYADSCAACGQASEIGNGPMWSPEEL